MSAIPHTALTGVFGFTGGFTEVALLSKHMRSLFASVSSAEYKMRCFLFLFSFCGVKHRRRKVRVGHVSKSLFVFRLENSKNTSAAGSAAKTRVQLVTALLVNTDGSN